MKAGLQRILRIAAGLPRGVRLPVAVFLATRVGIVIVAYLSAPIVADNPFIQVYHLRGTDNILVDVFGSRWDTGFYVSIVEEGYKYEGVVFPSVAFFPLLPLVMRFFLPLTGDAVPAGILAANLALLGAALLFYRLVDLKWGPETAGRAVWYLLIFPVSFFGSAIYSESLFLLAAIAALLFARQGRWEASAAAGFLAGLSRFMGLIVAPLLLIEWLVRRRGPPEERPPWTGILAPASVPLGTLAYMGFLQSAFGDPLAFLRGSAAWGRAPASPLAMIANLFAAPEAGWVKTALAGGWIRLDDWIDFLFVLLFVILGIVLLVKREWAEGTFVLVGALIPLSSGLWASQRRYMWVLFPAFILLARWGGRPWVDRTVTAVSLALLGYFTALFANWYWVG